MNTFLFFSLSIQVQVVALSQLSPPIFFSVCNVEKYSWEGLGMRYVYIATGRTLYVHVPITSGVYMLVGE